MANPAVALKAPGDKLYGTEVNAIVTAFPTKIDGTEKPFAIGAPGTNTGLAINHGFGTKLGLSTVQYHLTVLVTDATGAQISATITKTTADSATLNFDDSDGPLIGVALLRATPF